MNLEQLKAEHPDLVAQIVAEATEGMLAAAEVQPQIDAAKTEGAEAERKRISDVRGQVIPGHEALIEKLAFDGKSTGADAALAIVAAEKTLRSKAAADLDSEAPPAVPAVNAEDGLEQKTIKRAVFNALSQLEQRQAVAAGTKVVD